MKKTSRNPREFLTVADAAQRLGLPRKTLYGWTSKGVIPSVQLGGRILIPIAELEAAIERGRHVSKMA